MYAEARVQLLLYYLKIASDKCQQEKRKTINGDDLLWAMAALGFDKYTEPLKLYLQKYKEVRILKLYQLIVVLNRTIIFGYNRFVSL